MTNIINVLPRALAATSIVSLLMFSAATFAERVSLHVAFGNVPGLEELENGRINAAIDLLEARRSGHTLPLRNERSTLCAAYILASRYDNALPVCEEAVQNDDEDIAYNNRGVLRAHLGDYAGALRDFEVIRLSAEEQRAFLEAIRRSHPRTMATANHDVLQKIQAQTARPRLSFGESRPAARIENIRP